MGLLENIREDAKKSGQNKGKFLYVRDGSKVRIRFLQDMQDGFEVPFHDSFELGINVPCKEFFGKTCPYCGEEDIRTRNQYAWSVWDYEAKEVKIFMYAMNNCTPIASIASMYENYGTLLDRDYVIQRNGKGQSTTYSVIPMDKNKFRNEKAKPFSKSAFMKLLDKAFPDDKSEKFGKDSDDEEEMDYSEMSAKELYNLCEERGIEAEPKMKQKYYIELLEEYNSNKADDNDDWDEDDDLQLTKYNDMSAKELYKLCKERDIEALPKKNEKYYINLLEEDDKAHDDWDDEESDDETPWDEDDKSEDDDEWEDE